MFNFLRHQGDNASQSTELPRTIRRTTQRALKQCMKSHKLRIPKYDLPVRIRPWFFMFTSLIMIILSFLGFTNYTHQFPLNEVLHFICFCLATGVFYFIWDVDENSRRIWIWRNSGVILTLVVCFFFGGLMSEVVQSMLPYKEFQIGDVVANIFGSSLGLWCMASLFRLLFSCRAVFVSAAYHLDRYYRHRREISRLYQPLSQEEDMLLSDSDSETNIPIERSVPLLPTFRAPSKPQSRIQLGNVWDENEELFGIGDDEDEDEFNGPTRPQHQSNTHISHPNVKVVVIPPST